MISLRPSEERGYFNHGWLDTFHTFSFGEYEDPSHVSFRSLRVINEDVVAPGHGFGMHPHRNMEIVTYLLSGAIEHQDSLGSRGVIRPGEIQRITAGSGVLHSEKNPSDTEPVHLLQIWIVPRKTGLTPSYEQRAIPDAVAGKLTLLASESDSASVVKINQDAEIWRGLPKANEAMTYPVRSGRGVWIQVAKGSVTVNGQTLDAGDGAGIENESEISISAISDSEFLLFDLG